MGEITNNGQRQTRHHILFSTCSVL